VTSLLGPPCVHIVYSEGADGAGGRGNEAAGGTLEWRHVEVGRWQSVGDGVERDRSVQRGA